MPVERAFEANEGATSKKQNKPIKPPDSILLTQSSTLDNTTELKPTTNNEGSRLPTNVSRSLTTCSSSDSSSDDIERIRKSRYEIPDDQMSRKAANILAGRKEVEMHEFYGGDEDNSECDDRKLVLVPNIDPTTDRDSPENF